MRVRARLACAAALSISAVAPATAQSGRVSVCAASGDTLAPFAIDGVAVGERIRLPSGAVPLPREIDSAYVALEPQEEEYRRSWSTPDAKMPRDLGYVPVGRPASVPIGDLTRERVAAGSLLLSAPQADPKRAPWLYVLTPGCRIQWLTPAAETGDVVDVCARPGEPRLVTPAELRERRARHRRHPVASDPPRCR